MTQAEIDKRVDELVKRFDDVNTFFIEAVASQVKRIGELIPSTMHMISIMASMNEDMSAINQRLAKAMQLTIPNLYSLYADAMDSYYKDPRFIRALKETPLSPVGRARLRHYTEAVSRQTAGTLFNLSNTTLASNTYRRVVDIAILAVSSGMTDYKQATRQSIREIGRNGLQMQYPSGYHRRLDTAVRQNIIDGVNQIAQNGSIMMGEELGYDAYELSAHARSAPDHEPIQGRVFLKEEFDRLQSNEPFQDIDGHHYDAIRRPIGEWNCMHIAMAFSTKYSTRQYSDAQLQKWADDNAKGCEIDGKHYTIYQASQLMRQIETQVRREKDAANAAKIVGDEDLRKECQIRINALARKYQMVANEANLKMRKDRMAVEGFKMVKIPQKTSHVGAREAIRNTDTAVDFNEKSDYGITLPGYADNLNKGLSTASRSVAEKGGSDHYEHMYLVNIRTGELDYYETNNDPNSVGLKFWDFLDEHEEENYAFVHNHNSDSSFSETDMRTLLTTKQIPIMIAVRNDAVKYIAERKGDPLKTGFFDDLYESDLKEINKQVREGKITLSERSKRRELKIVENLLRDYTKAGRIIEFDGRQK